VVQRIILKIGAPVCSSFGLYLRGSQVCNSHFVMMSSIAAYELSPTPSLQAASTSCKLGGEPSIAGIYFIPDSITEIFPNSQKPLWVT
jgi:hypothetical protein